MIFKIKNVCFENIFKLDKFYSNYTFFINQNQLCFYNSPKTLTRSRAIINLYFLMNFHNKTMLKNKKSLDIKSLFTGF